MNYTFNRQAWQQDKTKAVKVLGLWGVIPALPGRDSKTLTAFCVSGDRPKHVSWLPQVGQNFKNRDTVMLAERLAGATPIFRGTGRIDKSGDFARSMSIRYGGVNPFLPFNG